ncbi:MAG: 3'(2'),5'-bisphosphate nucleotidase CysQ [Polyangiaceae bacterium]|nr:3'(2'),5'-bisphosphate nucleotidase CysQ [Polyangiaceae bacterium]
MTLVEELLAIANEAALLVMEVYNRPFEVDFKGPNDPVTEADRRANQFICERLAALCPGAPIVAEESDPLSFREFRQGERIFFVDPVDGTREFVQKNGQFAVMIGMVEGTRATCGVIVAPALQQAWAGDLEHGAFEVDAQGKRKTIRTSDHTEARGIRIVASRSHRTPTVQAALDAIEGANVSALGSAGLKGTWVASGRAEAYVAPGAAGQRWDCCALDAIVTAAGGRVTDAWGDPIDYRAGLINDRGILASNGHLHGSLLEQLAKIRGAG